MSVRVEALTLGRRLELDQALWPEAQAAFRIASRLADVSRMEAQR